MACPCAAQQSLHTVENLTNIHSHQNSALENKF